MQKDSTLTVSTSAFGKTTESQEVIEVRNYQTTPAVVKLGVQRVINLGEYNSLRVDVALELPCYVEEIAKQTKRALLFLDRQMDAAIEKFESKHMTHKGSKSK